MTAIDSLAGMADSIAAVLDHQPKPGTALACPHCGNEDVSSNDIIAATARGGWIVGGDGEPEFDPCGDTDVWWDTQENVKDAPWFCTSCSASGTLDQLIPVIEADDDAR